VQNIVQYFFLKKVISGLRCVSVVGQEQLIRSEYMKSPPIFMGVRVSRPLVFCVVLWRSFVFLFSCFFLPLCTRWEIRIGITVLLFLNFKAYPIFENTQ
jgi:hypothetical protein